MLPKINESTFVFASGIVYLPIPKDILHDSNATAVPMGDMMPVWFNGQWFNMMDEYKRAKGLY